jgi:anti-anti-sigma factor
MADATPEPAPRTPHDALLFVRGEVDTSSVGELQRRLDQANARGPEMTVDMSPVTFIDAAGLRPLLGARKTQEPTGGKLRLAGPSSAVVRLLSCQVS